MMTVFMVLSAGLPHAEERRQARLGGRTTIVQLLA
jgi:hypothetical protein